mmetsp:Transcript_47731/g.113412  ORF Transcript_47731/g.113412 Transcript_47731/m.113412 type:complete len:664 (+) Transcript_47731:59-2050(+)
MVTYQVPAQALHALNGGGAFGAKLMHPATACYHRTSGGSSAVAPAGRGPSISKADTSWEQACSAAVLPTGASIVTPAADGDMRPRRSMRRSSSQVQRNSPSPSHPAMPAFAQGASSSILANATPSTGAGPPRVTTSQQACGQQASQQTLPQPPPPSQPQAQPQQQSQQQSQMSVNQRQPLLQLGQPFKVQVVSQQQQQQQQQPSPAFRKAQTPQQLPPRWPAVPQEQRPPIVNPEAGAGTSPSEPKLGGQWFARSATPRHGLEGMPREPLALKADESGSPRAPSPVRYGRQCSPFLRRPQLSFQPVPRGVCRTPLPPRPAGRPPYSASLERPVATARSGSSGEHQVTAGGASIVQEAPLPEDDDGSEEGVHPSLSCDPFGLQLDPVEQINYDELEFLEHLGSGEFGQVCRGRYHGREVAIKQLFWDNTSTGEAVLKDLAREIESFRHLRHKRLVQFIGACLEIPHPCLITEYMPGGSLHHLLHVRRLRLPLLHGTNMCLQLTDGVKYLHAQTPRIVHRDLKSQNVVLDMQLNLKLCDFGLTEPMEETQIAKQNNGGSPRYMAPELFDSLAKITEKVDIWAMGCIFIEIFSRTLPYEGINTLPELTRELMVHKRPPQWPGPLPEALEVVIRSCHNFDYRLRPSARRVFDELRIAKRGMREDGIV